MVEIKSLSAPALGEREVKRLIGFCTPKRMTSECTLFDTGYEQAKRDMLEMLVGALNVPNSMITVSPTPETIATAERLGFFDSWRRRK